MKTILVVEDDLNNRDLLSQWLRLQGYTVVTASDGIEGLLRAKTTQPDLILMDIGLPKLNGWQLAYRLKSSEATRAIPIIALTAFALSDARKQSLSAGCDDYETKPIDFPQLAKKITHWLNTMDTANQPVQSPS